MISVKVPKTKTKYGFTFRYYNDRRGRPVECRIFKGDEILANGVATTHFRDKYDKRFGRKLAFSYALMAAKFSRSVRTTFWEVFHDRIYV